MILPLPLVPWEEYMLADDRPAYPMNFFMRLRFSGRLDRAALEAALHTALARHPLLCATVRQMGRRRLQWVAASHQRPLIRWLPRPSPDGYPHAEPIDLRAEPGLKITVLEGETSADLLAQFHHACCDGLGAMLLLQDLLLAYAARLGAAHGTLLRPLDEASLRRRGHFGLTVRSFLAILHRQLVGVLGAWQFFTHAPVPLVPYDPKQHGQSVPDAYPAACSRQFTPAESADLREAATRLGVTTNELLVRDLFLALEAWRARHCPGGDRDWLRLAVPVSLRTVAHRALPAANMVSMVFLDRQPRSFSDPEGLVRGVHRQMERIKRLRLGLTFVLSLWAVKAVPGALSRMAAAEKCSATGVFTNLGVLLAKTPLPRQQGRIVLGDAALESLDILAPLRPNTCVAFAVFTYAERQCVTLHYDPRPLRAAEAEELLQTFVERVAESMRAGGASRQAVAQRGG